MKCLSCVYYRKSERLDKIGYCAKLGRDIPLSPDISSNCKNYINKYEKSLRTRIALNPYKFFKYYL